MLASSVREAFEEEASAGLRAAGLAKLCRKELLSTPSGYFVRQDDEPTKPVFIAASLSKAKRVNARTTKSLYQPVATPAPSIKHGVLVCPSCGGTKSKFSAGPKQVCASCYRKRAVSRYVRRVLNIHEIEERLANEFRYAVPVQEIRGIPFSSFEDELIEQINAVEEMVGVPIVRWKKERVALDGLAPCIPPPASAPQAINPTPDADDSAQGDYMTFLKTMTALPAYIDRELWAAFVESRAAMKVPFTPLAQKLVVRKLMGLHADGWDPNASLEKSAIYGWKSVFPVEKIAADPNRKDAALEKIEEDRKRAVPPPAAIRDRMNALRGKAVAHHD